MTTASEGEIIMDVEVVHAIAPGAHLIVDTHPRNSQDAALGQMDILDTQSQIVDQNPGAIISESWGGCESPDASSYYLALNDTFTKAQHMGDTVFFASGDSGAYTCYNAQTSTPTGPGPQDLGVSAPSSLPTVTAVGGTRLSVRTDGSWFDEVAWEGVTDMSGTGGGVSGVFARPDWQTAPGVDNLQSNPNRMRSVPDVSADADPVSGIAIISGGHAEQGGGTSQSAPIWAGITALIDQYLSQRHRNAVGFFNPALYALARGPAAFPPFHDVTVGDNLYYPATAGYDLATGLGTPDGWNLARDLETYQQGAG
jgi:kumamolisin